MSSQIKCTFKIDSWKEDPFSKKEDGPTLIRASVIQSYSGSLKAKSTIEYLMTNFEDGTSSFIGIEEIIGELDGKSGSFLLNHKGSHKDGVAKSSFDIISDSGTGELEGISGSGHYEATHDQSTFTLFYELKEN